MPIIDYASLGQTIYFAAENEIRRSAPKMLWNVAYPIIKRIRGDGRINKGFRVEGFKAIIPVVLTDNATAAAGVTDANAFTALTPNATQGLENAQYEFTRAHNAFWLKPDEIQLIAGASKRLDIVETKTRNHLASYDKLHSGWIVGNSADSRSNMMGLRYALSTSNTVGGISQGTYAVWQGGRVVNAGPFDPSILDLQIRRINNLGRSTANMLVLSSYATNDVFGKLGDIIGAAQILTNTESKAKYGYTSYTYKDCDVIEEPNLGAADPGSALVLASDSWYYGQSSDRPRMRPVRDLAGTGAQEFYSDWWTMFGTDDPASNSYISGFDA